MVTRSVLDRADRRSEYASGPPGSCVRRVSRSDEAGIALDGATP